MGYVTIKDRKDFLKATASGKKFITGSFILQMFKREEIHSALPGEIRVGFTVTKKMGGAVTRNRIKRRLREAVKPALLKNGLAGHDYVVISRLKALDCDFCDLKRDMEFAFSRIIHHKGNTPKTDNQIK